MLCHGNFDPEFRRIYEHDLLRLYVDTISSIDAGYREFDDLMHSCVVTLNFWFALWCHGGATKGETTQRAKSSSPVSSFASLTPTVSTRRGSTLANTNRALASTRECGFRST